MTAQLDAQSAGSQQDTAIFQKILDASLLFIVDVTVSSVENSTVLWSTTVSRITIPGREIGVSLEGPEGKLRTVFTIYPSEIGHLLLAVQPKMENQPVEIAMEIQAAPFLEPLDDNSRSSLERILDTSSKFHFNGKNQ